MKKQAEDIRPGEGSVPNGINELIFRSRGGEVVLKKTYPRTRVHFKKRPSDPQRIGTGAQYSGIDKGVFSGFVLDNERLPEEVELVCRDVLISEDPGDTGREGCAEYQKEVTLTIPADYSMRQYRALYADEAYAFRDKILGSYKPLLQRIFYDFFNSNLNRADRDLRKDRGVVYFTETGVYDDAENALGPVEFSGYGMNDLGSFNEVYGFLLAFCELIRELYIRDDRFEFDCSRSGVRRYGAHVIRLRYYTKQDKPDLKEW